MCDCYKIGGPFIAEDPECPVHGYEAQREQKYAAQERENAKEEQEFMFQELNTRIEKLESLIQSNQQKLEIMLNALAFYANPDSYEVDDQPVLPGTLDPDKGQTARKAIKELKKVKG